MPIYEYKCQKCGEKFEKRVGFFHSGKCSQCPKCGDEQAERVFSPFSSTASSCSTTGRYR
jgi:putative FmdB family regulatory protein